jgi:hypothetical protein
VLTCSASRPAPVPFQRQAPAADGVPVDRPTGRWHGRSVAVRPGGEQALLSDPDRRAAAATGNQVLGEYPLP